MATELQRGLDASVDRLAKAKAAAEEKSRSTEHVKLQLVSANNRISELEKNLKTTGAGRAAAVHNAEKTRRDMVDLAVWYYIAGGDTGFELIKYTSKFEFAEQSHIDAYTRTISEKMERSLEATNVAAAALAESELSDTNTLYDLRNEQRKLNDDLLASEAEYTLALGEVNAAEVRLRDAETALNQLVTTGGSYLGAAVYRSDIPFRVLKAYIDAADKLAVEQPACRLRWWMLAGIGRNESNHGRLGGATVDLDGKISPAILGPRLDGGKFAAIPDTDGGALDGDTAWDRAVGPMQFIPSTWKGYVRDDVTDPHDIDDAALAAGRYLCRGRGAAALDTMQGLKAAIFSYNHSSSYVTSVVNSALRYWSLGIGWENTVTLYNVGDPAVLGKWAPAARQVLNVSDAAADATGTADGSTVVINVNDQVGEPGIRSAIDDVSNKLVGRNVVLIFNQADAEAVDRTRNAVPGWAHVQMLVAVGVDGEAAAEAIVGAHMRD